MRRRFFGVFPINFISAILVIIIVLVLLIINAIEPFGFYLVLGDVGILLLAIWIMVILDLRKGGKFGYYLQFLGLIYTLFKLLFEIPSVNVEISFLYISIVAWAILLIWELIRRKSELKETTTLSFQRVTAILITVFIVGVVYVWIYTREGFVRTVIGGYIEYFPYEDADLCEYYQNAKIDLDYWLKENGFVQIESPTQFVPLSGIHDVNETLEWYTWYEGRYKRSSRFYIYVVIPNDPEYSHCNFTVSIKYDTYNFKWRLNKDEVLINEFSEGLNGWWEEYNQENLTEYM